MANSKHTPGPWSNNKWNHQEHQISALGGTIALVSHDHSLVSDREADANARLIAAAPEMYEALSLIVGLWDNTNLVAATPIPAHNTITKARAILAKAEGQPA